MPPIVALYVLWMLWFLSWMAAALSSSRSDRKLSTAQNIAYSAVVIIGGLLLFGVTPAPGMDVQYRLWMSPKESLGWLAVGVAFVAFCFAWWATISRGLSRNAPVVASGPYKVVRHPIYASLIIASFATVAADGRPSSLCGALLLLLAFVVRIFIEEHAMRDESADYDDYADRVPMLMPLRLNREAPLRHAEAVASPPSFATAAFEEPVAPVLTAELGSSPELAVEEERDTVLPAVTLEDERSESEPEAKPGTVTTKAVQLTLALEQTETEQALETAGSEIAGGAANLPSAQRL